VLSPSTVQRVARKMETFSNCPTRYRPSPETPLILRLSYVGPVGLTIRKDGLAHAVPEAAATARQAARAMADIRRAFMGHPLGKRVRGGSCG